MTSRRHKRDERGAVAGLEGLAFGVLIFVFGMLVVANAWGVIDAKMATSAAAREAARAYVESSTSSQATSAAAEAASASLAGQHRAISSVAVESADGRGFSRCAPIVARVATKVPRVPLPLFHTAGGAYEVASTHREVVDPYRAGLSGAASCSTD